MPELPEVETMVRGIREAVTGAKLVDVRACPCPCRPITLTPSLPQLQKQSIGRTIVAARRRAKRVILELDSGAAFVIEPRMTGLMLLGDPPDPEHLRIEWRLVRAGGGRVADVRSVWFWDRRGLGTVRLLPAEELATLMGTTRLGPDALEMTVELWRERLGSVARPVKVALLDQRLVAGIGNLYASEILHRSGIHPEARTDRLTRRQIERIDEATRFILEEAIRYEGSTLGDGTYRNALNKDGGYQNAHKVYDREDAPCPTCGGAPVRRFVQAQRATFFCPACQKKRDK